LRQWTSQDARRTVWVDLTNAHDDVVVLRAATAAAAAGVGPCVMVLDDAHNVSGKTAQETVKSLIEDLPKGSTLIYAGRSRPDLMLGLFRASQSVIDVELQDLALSVLETANLFELAGVTVPDDAIAALVERTGGWPAAVHIALVAATQAADPAAAVREFAGDDRRLVELLDAEVLDRLSSTDVDFLLAVADLPHLAGPLCDAVLERSGSAALLERLASETLLVLPLDQRRSCYRLHNVLQTFLRSEQHLRRGPTAQEILARGSRWFEEAGDVDTAISLAARAHDAERATELVLAHFSAKVSTGDPLSVERWLRELKQDNVPSSPALEAVSALVHMGVGDPDGTLRCLQRAEFGLPERQPQSGPYEQPAACVAALRALLGWGSAEAMRDDARYARRHTTSPVWFSIAALADGAASFLLGELAEAEEALLAAGALAETTSFTTWAMSFSCLALLYERNGERAKAVAAARRAKQIVIDLKLQAIPQLYLVPLTSAYFDELSGHGNDVLADLQKGLAHRARCIGIAPWGQLQSSILLAGLAHLHGDSREKLRWLAEADETLLAIPDALLAKEQIAELRRLTTVPKAHRDELSMLSVAELRVLQYLPTHLTLAEIADKLFLSRHTVKSHVVAVYRKLDAANRNEAVQTARRSGMLADTSNVTNPASS
jgi:LuxR family maltose regulon positive regulatory protein